MKYLSLAEHAYVYNHLNRVRHITLDPNGPGAVRIHLVPCRKPDRTTPFVAILNGQDILPLQISWAILLANLMDALQPFAGKEISPADWAAVKAQAAAATRKIYRTTPSVQIESDLQVLLDCLLAIAQGKTPPVSVQPLRLADYTPRLAAPHRMDLMVSAMTKDGAWHCNQKCLHCYAAGQPMGETAELSTEEWKKVLDRLRHANIPQVTFTGGEPTMRPDLAELVEAAQWFVTRLNTNGRLLTPDLCRQLYEASLDSVQVTLYAADEAVHNQLVGAPGFADTVQGIRNAVAAGLIVSVNTPLCSLNRDYAATLRLAHELGVRYATCSGLIPSGEALGDESRATRLSHDELLAVLQEAVSTARELGMELDFTSPGWLEEPELREMGLHLIPSCGACLSNMAITPDGTVVPCQSWLGGVQLGHILTDDWQTIWDSPTCRDIRQKSAAMEHICQLHTGNQEGEA